VYKYTENIDIDKDLGDAVIW